MRTEKRGLEMFDFIGKMVGGTGIEPVTPTMSRSAIFAKYLKYNERTTSKFADCSRYIHGNPGQSRAKTGRWNKHKYALAIVSLYFALLPNPGPLPSLASTILASWYGPGFHGRRTANGERFNQWAMTAAHKSLPFGTMVRVTHKGRSVTVRINDRGPFVRGRSLDLSKGAARQIGCAGVCRVSMVVVGRKHRRAR